MKRITRRAFLSEIGATTAIVVFGVAFAACGDDDGVAGTSSAPEEPSQSSTTSEAPPATPASSSPDSTASPDPQTTTSTEGTVAGPVTWERVNLGFVSAYVLVRNGTAAVVDTGVSGSTGDIEAALARIGLGWGSVAHVVLTHLHRDHIGSLPNVMAAAGAATAYAGAADIDAMESPRPVVAVGDGDEVFGLEIVETPGHTAGHICVYDPAGPGLLVAGDALNGSDGGVVGANPRFTSDMALANESIRKLAQLSFGTVLFGHGEPVLENASALVGELAATL